MPISSTWIKLTVKNKMMNPDFTKINYQSTSKSTGNTAVPSTPTSTWQNLEQIEVRPFYTPRDLQHMEHLDFVAGIPPYLRGPYPAMSFK